LTTPPHVPRGRARRSRPAGGRMPTQLRRHRTSVAVQGAQGLQAHLPEPNAGHAQRPGAWPRAPAAGHRGDPPSSSGSAACAARSAGRPRRSTARRRPGSPKDLWRRRRNPPVVTFSPSCKRCSAGSRRDGCHAHAEYRRFGGPRSGCRRSRRFRADHSRVPCRSRRGRPRDRGGAPADDHVRRGGCDVGPLSRRVPPASAPLEPSNPHRATAPRSGCRCRCQAAERNRSLAHSGRTAELGRHGGGHAPVRADRAAHRVRGGLALQCAPDRHAHVPRLPPRSPRCSRWDGRDQAGDGAERSGERVADRRQLHRRRGT